MPSLACPRSTFLLFVLTSLLGTILGSTTTTADSSYRLALPQRSMTHGLLLYWILYWLCIFLSCCLGQSRPLRFSGWPLCLSPRAPINRTPLRARGSCWDRLSIDWGLAICPSSLRVVRVAKCKGSWSSVAWTLALPSASDGHFCNPT